MARIKLGGYAGVYSPDYQVDFFRDGDPRRSLNSRFNENSLTSLQTSKSIGDISGTWSMTFKDGRARHVLREMDTCRIRLRGHGDERLITVLKGVVDDVDAVMTADTTSALEDTPITGRCAAKYLQVTSLFLPVWDPQAPLPTALTFGLGDAAKKVGGNRPYDIFRYLVRKYTYGEGQAAGESGIPNSRYWLDHFTRFARGLDFQVPYLQYDETSVADALKQMEVLGFTETWVDELGRIVYRHPGWDQPVAYSLSTDDIISHSLSRSDVDCATYVEVIPAGDPGIDSATAQALMAGRAPVPSSYLQGGSQLGQYVSPGYIIETDAKGMPTKAGLANPWYKLQRRLGVRPQQITSPLIATQRQAQAQAEGLLRFLSRMQKGGTVTIPGDPRVRLGHTILIEGDLDGVPIKRVFYIEGVAHDFQWGSHYTTTLTLSHGRDPWDPSWRELVLPRFDPADLSDPTGGGGGGGGVLAPAPSGPGAEPASGGGASGNGQAVDSQGVHATAAATKNLTTWRNPDGSTVWICKWIKRPLDYAMNNGWDGWVSEGWRSYQTEDGYIHDGNHTPGVNVASSATASNHSKTVYPGGAVDVRSPAALNRALVLYDGPHTLHGNGYALPGDIPHFSADGH